MATRRNTRLKTRSGNSNGHWLLPSLEIPNPPSDTRCYFLELPLEIRVIIYNYIIETDGFVALDHFNPWPNDFDGVTVNRRSRVYARSHLRTGEILLRGVLQRPGHRPEIDIFKRPAYVLADGNSDTQALQREQRREREGISERLAYAVQHDAIPVYRRQSPKELPHIPIEATVRPNAALLFVCRKSSEEFAAMLYSRTVFAFTSSRAIRNFVMEPKAMISQPALLLAQAVPESPISLSFIRALCLQHKRQSQRREAPLRAVRMLSDNYYNNWKSACLLIVEKLVALNNLALFIELPRGEDATLSMSSDWIAPFLQFSQSKQLKFVSVSLSGHGPIESVAPLEAFAEEVRKKILGCDDAQALATITDIETRVDFIDGIRDPDKF